MQKYTVVAGILSVLLMLIFIIVQVTTPGLRRKAGALVYACEPVTIWFLSARNLIALGVVALVLQFGLSAFRGQTLTAESYRGWLTMGLTLASLWMMNSLRISLGGIECRSNGILFFGRLMPWETIRGFTWLDSPPKLRLHLLGNKTVDCAVGMEYRPDLEAILAKHDILDADRAAE